MRTLVALGLVLCAALSGCTQRVAEAQGTVCGDVAWGGWAGEPRCAALAQRVISGSDRACTTDADCVLIHPGASCRNAAVSASRVDAYRSQPVPCTNPAAGPCSPGNVHCSSGCCVGF